MKARYNILIAVSSVLGLCAALFLVGSICLANITTGYAAMWSDYAEDRAEIEDYVRGFPSREVARFERLIGQRLREPKQSHGARYEPGGGE
jgi:hypothetical protein